MIFFFNVIISFFINLQTIVTFFNFSREPRRVVLAFPKSRFPFRNKPHEIWIVAVRLIQTEGASIDVARGAFMRPLAIRLADSDGSTAPNPLSPVRPKARACWIAEASLSCFSLFIGVVSEPNNAPVLADGPGVTRPGGCREATVSAIPMLSLCCSHFAFEAVWFLNKRAVL